MILSSCCAAPVHAETEGGQTVLRCSSCKAFVDSDGKQKEQVSLFDYIWDGFSGMTDKEVEECLASGHFYQPYVPMQVTPIRLKEKK